MKPKCKNCQMYIPMPENRIGSTGKCPGCHSLLKVISATETMVLQYTQPKAQVSNDKMFAHYQIESELGRGGMGLVYKAIDLRLNRTVALKVVLKNQEIGERQLKRFIQEAKSLGQLDHPNVVKVYEVGEHPQHYFTMEYISGITLAQHIKIGDLKPVGIATLFQKIAEALYLVHKNGIVHRDLKPNNIMIANNEPKVMDFGLAKVEESNLSQSGDLVGTPAYMSPEQVNNKKINFLSDVYSLGATLYEVLTGRPVFQGTTFVNLLVQIANEDPINPRNLNPDIPIELEAICLKCIEKNPARRYSNMRALADDLKNFQEHRPITARAPGKITIFLKWTRRNKPIVIILAIAILLIASGTIAFVIHLQSQLKHEQQLKQQAKKAEKEIREEKENAQTAWKKTKEAKQKLETTLQELKVTQNKLQVGFYPFVIHLAEQNREKSNIAMVDYLLNSSYCPKRLRNWEWNWLKRKSHEESFTLEGDSLVHSFNLTKSNKFISSDRHNIKIWDLKKRKILANYKHAIMEKSVISADGKKILCWSDRGGVKLIDIATGTVLQSFIKRMTVRDFAISPNGKFVVAGGTGLAYVWKIDGTLLHTWEAKGAQLHACAFSPDNKIIALGDDHWQISLFDIATGRLLRKLKGHRNGITACAFSPDNKTLLSGSLDSNLKLWEIKTGRLLKTFSSYKIIESQQTFFSKGHKGPVRTCAFSPNGSKIISGGDDRTLKLWDTKSGKLLRTLRGHSNKIFFCKFINKKQVVSSGFDKKIKVWDIQELPNPLTIKAHIQEIYTCAFSPDGKFIASAGKDMAVRLWDSRSGKLKKTLVGHFGPIYHCRFDSSGKRLVTTGRDGTLRIWSIAAGTAKVIKAHKRAVLFCDFYTNGTQLLSCGRDSKIKLWDISTGKLLKTFTSFQYGINKCSWLIKRNILLSISEGVEPFKMIDFKSGKVLKVTGMLAPYFYDLSSDNRTIAIAADHLAIFSIDKWKILKLLKGNDNRLNYCVFSPDGTRIVATDGTTLKMWDVKTGEFLLALKGHRGLINQCSFSADGKRIVSASNGVLKIWSCE